MPAPKVPGLNPEERSTHAQIAALELHSRLSPEEEARHTEPARRAFMKRFEDQVDPERKLPPKERARRADQAMRAHMARLRLLRARKRAQRSTS
jgi:hypothetical protein